MSGQFAHIEIPADDTEQARHFCGSLFGWEFNAFPTPNGEYHMARVSESSGGAVTNMEPGKRGTRTYFNVDGLRLTDSRTTENGVVILSYEYAGKPAYGTVGIDV